VLREYPSLEGEFARYKVGRLKLNTKSRTSTIQSPIFTTSGKTRLSSRYLCFFVDLKPAPNNKDIFQIEHLQQCKVTFEAPKQKSDIAQCANCQRYGHTKNYCLRTPRCVKCSGTHLTSQWSRKERSSNVCCVLCNGNHPANYKGCMVYKDLQKKTFPPLGPKIYIPPPNLKQTSHTQPGATYAQIANSNSYSHQQT
jgi:hypothetical protein